MTLCTIDVHSRDVMQRLIDERCENGACFQWQSQLRYKQNEKNKECQINICDADDHRNYHNSPSPAHKSTSQISLFACPSRSNQERDMSTLGDAVTIPVSISQQAIARFFRPMHLRARLSHTLRRTTSRRRGGGGA